MPSEAHRIDPTRPAIPAEMMGRKGLDEDALSDLVLRDYARFREGAVLEQTLVLEARRYV